MLRTPPNPLLRVQLCARYCPPPVDLSAMAPPCGSPFLLAQEQSLVVCWAAVREPCSHFGASLVRSWCDQVETAPTKSDRLGRLLRQRVSSGGRLLDHRRILLGNLVHLVYRGVALVESGRLLLGAMRDLADNVVDLGYFHQDATQRLSAFVDQCHTCFNLLPRSGNQRLNLFGRLGRLGRALRQRSHFGRDNSKAAASVASPCCFYAGIQG